MDRTLIGAYHGTARPGVDFLWLPDLYRDGRLKQNELITRYRPLNDINEAFDYLVHGTVARTVRLFE